MNAIQSRPEFKWWDAVLGILGALFIVAAWLGGLVTNVVNVLLMAYIPVALVTRVWAAFKGKLETGFVRRPSASEHRWFLVQALVRWGFLGVWVLVLRASIVPLQLGDNLKSIWIMLALVFIAVALFPLFPKKRSPRASTRSRAWHKAYGRKAQKVTIEARKTAQITLSFRAE